MPATGLSLESFIAGMARSYSFTQADTVSATSL